MLGYRSADQNGGYLCGGQADRRLAYHALQRVNRLVSSSQAVTVCLTPNQQSWVCPAHRLLPRRLAVSSIGRW
jgi:hypothetical protein